MARTAAERRPLVMKRSRRRPIRPASNRDHWVTVAAALQDELPRDRLHPAVVAWADSDRSRRPWLVAFSGGADSLALLMLVWAHWPQRRSRLIALHFNHRLRGRQADADEAFCRKVCAEIGVRFIAGRWRDARPGASEAESRRARLSFFAEVQEKERARALWLGHQLDDIAESMLMRLARGSGTAGLAAPRPVQPWKQRVHLRPLLGLRKKEIVRALKRAGADWREDRTNAEGSYFRNRIRNRVVPAWVRAAVDRDALAGAALSRAALEEDDAALEAWVDQIQPLAADRSLQLQRLAGKPRAIIRRALHRWLLAQPERIDVSRQAFSALLAAAESGGPMRHSLGTNTFAVIKRGRLVFEKRAERRPRGGKRGRKFQPRSIDL